MEQAAILWDVAGQAYISSVDRGLVDYTAR
jgi:hypothetical protein